MGEKMNVGKARPKSPLGGVLFSDRQSVVYAPPDHQRPRRQGQRRESKEDPGENVSPAFQAGSPFGKEKPDRERG